MSQPDTLDKAIEFLTKAQRDRLAFIELRLRFIGGLRRHDLVERFGLQEAAATRDIRQYKSLAVNNIKYDAKAKTYLMGECFQPLFALDTERVLSWLVHGYSDGAESQSKTWIISDGTTPLIQPDLDTLAGFTQAIFQGCSIAIHYHSLPSGITQREIVPFALVNTSSRWYTRAFDRKSQNFRDFVLTRIELPQLLLGLPIEAHEHCHLDGAWNRTLELVLVPHPEKPRPEIAERDYGMKHGALHLTLRAATVGYTLRKWDVDCSPQHRLRGSEFHLWLLNHQWLRDIENAVLAHGYQG